jgi:hypothetical protein
MKDSLGLSSFNIPSFKRQTSKKEIARSGLSFTITGQLASIIMVVDSKILRCLRSRMPSIRIKLVIKLQD